MKWLIAILFIFLGSFLFSLKIDDIGIGGFIIKIIIGFGCIFIAGSIVGNKNEKK